MVIFAACPIDLIDEGGVCEKSDDCAAGLVCVEGASGKTCQAEGAANDAGSTGDDAGPNADAGPAPDSGPGSDSGPAADAGSMTDSGPAMDAGSAPDSGPVADGGSDGDSGAGPLLPDCSDVNAFSTQLLVSSFDNGILSTPGASDIPGDAWTQHEGSGGMRRQNDELNIGGTEMDPIRSASTPHRALDHATGDADTQTWLLRAFIEPGATYVGQPNGHIVAFLIQSATGNSPAPSGVGVELSSRNAGALRIVKRMPDGGPGIAAEQLLASTLDVFTPYRVELCLDHNAAVASLFVDGADSNDAGPMASVTLSEDLIPFVDPAPLMRIEADVPGSTPMTKVMHLEFLRTP
jgi:hypothetical protein